MATKQISDLSAVTTHADADLVVVQQSVDGVARKGTWTSVKAFLKTYFDTLYGSLSNTPSAGEKAALPGTVGTPSGTNKYVTNDDTRIPSAGEKAALPGTAGTPSGTNKYVTNDDTRNTNTRTPVSHGASVHDSTVYPFPSQVKAVRTTTQTLTTGNSTRIQLNVESWDDNAEFDPTTNYRFTYVGASAIRVFVAGFVRFAGASGGYRLCEIKLNNAEMSPRFGGQWPSIGTDWVATFIAGEMSLVQNDYIELFGLQTSGGNLDVLDASLVVRRIK